MDRRLIGILGLAVACFGIGASAGQQVHIKGQNKTMGYCFDAALNEKGDRLYVAGGPGRLAHLRRARGRAAAHHERVHERLLPESEDRG